MRILVIRRDNIGDLVCTTPLIAALRRRYPEAHIAALVNSYNAAVLDGNPDVDAVHVYTKLKHRLPGQSRLGILAARLKMLARLRRERFDYVVLAKAGFDRRGFSLARQLRRQEIVGFVAAGSATAAITRPVKALDYDSVHEVEVMARLGEALDVGDARGPLRVYPDEKRSARWRERLALGRERRPWVAVHISAREASRRWRPAYWIQLIRELLRDATIGVLLLWAPGQSDDPRHPGDDANAAEILCAFGGDARVLAAPTRELADLIAVLGLCDAFIGADGGAMHLAAGLRKPIVAIFEKLASNPARWHPWKVPYELVQRTTPDASDISVAQVLAAWRSLSERLQEPLRQK